MIQDITLNSIDTFLKTGSPPPDLKNLPPKRRADHLADVLAKLLQNHERRSIQELLGPVTNHPVIDTTKTFLRKKISFLSKPLAGKLQTRLVAVKLGLSSKDLENNPGFETFAKKNILHRYLLLQGHNLEVDEDSGQILILCEGKRFPWSEVKKLYNIDETGHFEGKYGIKGLEKEGFSSWTELTPSMRRDPKEWENRYVVDLCNWTHHPLQILDNHTWLRLKTPTGDIYSVGEWPLDKGSKGSWTHSPLRVKRGRLISPDVSDAWRGQDAVVTLSFAITEKQFEKMKAQIEKDKATPDRPFHLLHANCTSYANHIIALAGVHLPVELDTIDILTPQPILAARKWTRRLLPPSLQKLASRSDAIAMNTLAWILGYNKVEAGINHPPYLTSLKDMLKMPRMDHPSLSYSIAKKVEKWRAEKKRDIAEQLEDIDPQDPKREALIDRLSQVDYELPEEFLL